MPRILRLPEAATDAAPAAQSPLLTQADLLKDPGAQATPGQKLAVWVTPADKVEDLAPYLGSIVLVAIEFPSPGEGRGYSYARLLRQRYGFKGEIRAVGPAVKQDLLFFMVRCGFDAFELAATENWDEARAALHRFTLAYQPAVPRAAVQEPRFTAARR
jgi:uncharacterized protein (DUF934 family)